MSAPGSSNGKSFDMNTKIGVQVLLVRDISSLKSKALSREHPLVSNVNFTKKNILLELKGVTCNIG